MDLAIPDLHAQLRDEASRFAQQLDAEHIELHGVGDAQWKSAGELGLLGLIAPEESGGVGLDALAFSLVTSSLASASPSFARRYVVLAGAGLTALGAGATEAHCGGETNVSFSDGELAPSAESLVFAGALHTNFSHDAKTTLGQRGAGLGHVSVQGQGEALDAENVAKARLIRELGIASIALGSGRSALDTATKYALERKQFKRPIAEFQAVQWKIADSATQLAAAEVSVFKAARTMSERDVAAARALAGRAAVLATDHAIQLHGGYGYTREYPVERHYRSARMCAAGLDAQRQQVYASAG